MRAMRLYQRLQMRRGRLSFERQLLPMAAAARSAAAPKAVHTSPTVLLRVDEFPHARALDDRRYDRDAFERFHDVLAEAGIPYLIAVLPHPSNDYLNPQASGGRRLSEAEVALLNRVGSEGVTLGLHGRDHRTRHARPSRHSELGGLRTEELEALLDDSLAMMGGIGAVPRVFVPPFNRFDASQWDVLARRFDVICGGPESVPLLGWHATPSWRGDAVWLPSYPPLYGRARDIVPAVERMAEKAAGAWLPVTLHLGWEVDDELAGLRSLAKTLAGRAVSWSNFLEEAAASAEPRASVAS
jgi:peptidoglycan/xylan/chitin deacetylase (PgdA/CDA1 family)